MAERAGIHGVPVVVAWTWSDALDRIDSALRPTRGRA
jgi:hypothetical protein